MKNIAADSALTDGHQGDSGQAPQATVGETMPFFQPIPGETPLTDVSELKIKDILREFERRFQAVGEL
jgi:hypothetical protein